MRRSQLAPGLPCDAPPRGAVCKTDASSDVDAMVVCRALGWAGSATLGDAPVCGGFGDTDCEALPPNVTIAWSSLACTGSEASPAGCAHQDANWQVCGACWRVGSGLASRTNLGRDRSGPLPPMQAWSPSGAIDAICTGAYEQKALRISCTDDAGARVLRAGRLGPPCSFRRWPA